MHPQPYSRARFLTAKVWLIVLAALSVLVGTFVAGAAGVVAAAPCGVPTGTFCGEYYANRTLAGSPTFTRTDGPPLNFAWGSGGPGNGLGVDDFSVRWQGSFSLTAATYTFTATADDGVRVWLDGSLLIDKWIDQAATTYTASRAVVAGQHTIKMEYYERGGQAVAKLSWSAGATSAPIAHVVVVWLENKEASQITASSMPYLYGLSTQYGRATQTYGVSHPSLPNYLAFWSGSTQGVTDDNNHDVNAASLSSQLTAAGKQWRVYAQNVPGNCYRGATATGGTDGPGVAGTYARKHEPAISFASVYGNATECAKIQSLGSFSPTAAAVAFVVPNLCNDTHDCSLAQGDAFLRAFLPSVLNSSDWAHTLLIVTFDEGSSNANGGGNVFTMVARPGLSGNVSSTFHNHYGVLRTIENIFGLPCLANACGAAPLSEFLP